MRKVVYRRVRKTRKVPRVRMNQEFVWFGSMKAKAGKIDEKLILFRNQELIVQCEF